MDLSITTLNLQCWPKRGSPESGVEPKELLISDLMRKGADKDIMNKAGKTAEMLANESDHKNTVAAMAGGRRRSRRYKRMSSRRRQTRSAGKR